MEGELAEVTRLLRTNAHARVVDNARHYASRFSRWEFCAPCVRSAAGVLLVFLFPGATLAGVVLCSVLLANDNHEAMRVICSFVDRAVTVLWTALPPQLQAGTVVVGFVVLAHAQGHLPFVNMFPPATLALTVGGPVLHPLFALLGVVLACKLGADIMLRNTAAHLQLAAVAPDAPDRANGAGSRGGTGL